MRRLREHLLSSTGALLLLAAVQVVLETLAAALVYRGQVLPAYGFFPTQIYDFLMKLRFAAGDRLAWLPEPPTQFLAPSTGAHLRVGLELLPAAIAMAVLLGLLGGIIGVIIGAVWPRRAERASVRGYLWAWAAVGLVVHFAAALPPLLLDETSSISQMFYRARSFVVDGTAVGLAVFLVSLGLSFALASTLARSGGAGPALAAGVLVLAAATSFAGSSPRDGTAAPPPVATGASAPAAAGDRLNLLLISLDSLRADHVGCYGYERDTSPAIDRLAREGVRFSEAIATSSWTLPTHLTMFTGRYQISHGVMHETVVLNPAVPTLGEIMKANGYTTAGFVSAPYVAAHYGYARGMDEYTDLSADYGHRREARSEIVSPRLNELVLPWLEQHKDDPFFLFVHNFDIHYDYIPPPPYDRMFADPSYTGTMDGTDFIERPDVNRKMDERDLDHILALYDGEIRFADDHVAKILEKLDQLGLRDETLVVLVSDHGDEFFEHGNKGHHRTVYEEVLRVPMVMRLPGALPAGKVVDTPVSLIDLLPTMLGVLGIEAPPGVEGTSLVSVMRGEPLAREAIYAEFFDKRGFNLQVARRTEQSKVIQHFNRITHPKRGAVEVYDLASDPLEEKDVADLQGERARSELAQMSGWLNERWSIHRELEKLAQGGNRIEIDDATMERLKSLGYVGE